MKADKVLIKCSEHNKNCTDYCTFERCNYPNLFICPRCIQKKMNHIEHIDCTNDITNISSITQFLKEISKRNINQTSNNNSLQSIIQQNNYFIQTLKLINGEIDKQIGIQKQNEDMLFNHIIAENLNQDLSNIPSKQLSELVKKINEKNILENTVFDEVKIRLEKTYKQLGQDLMTVFEWSDFSVAEKAENKKNDIIKQLVQVTFFQNKQLKQQKDFIMNEPLISKVEIPNKQDKYSDISFSDNQIQSDYQTQSEKEENNQLTSYEMADLFSSSLNRNNPKKIAFTNYGKNDEWNKKRKEGNQGIQNCRVEKQQNNDPSKSDTDQFEERKQYSEQRSSQIRSKSDGEQAQRKTKSKSLRAQSSESYKENLLKIFNPKLERTAEIGDANIYSIHQQSQLILLSLVSSPQVLQFYSINNLSFRKEIEFNNGNIIYAIMREDRKQVVIASIVTCCVFNDVGDFQFEESYTLKTNKERTIAKIEYISNDEIVIIFTDYSFEIFQDDDPERVQQLYMDKQQQSQNSVFFFQEIEHSLALLLKQNKCIQLLDLINLQEIQCIKEKYSLNCIEISTDKQIAATSGLSEYVNIYYYNQKNKDFDYFNKIETGHKDEILQTKLINGDKWLVTISGDCYWKVFDCQSTEMIYQNASQTQNVIIKCDYFHSTNQLVFIDQYGSLSIYSLLSNP